MLPAKLIEYLHYLRSEERSANTIAKYNRDLQVFFTFLNERPPEKSTVLLWKEQLIKTHAPASVNSMLAAVNGFLEWAGLAACKVKPLKIQRTIFARPEKELTQEEYRRLVTIAEQSGDLRLAMLLQTLCSTGIRVSELRYITVGAAATGRTVVDCKGKTRMILLPAALCHALRVYCRQKHIASGVIFRTKSGNPLDRTNIWKMMKGLCKNAGVAPCKVFPHNLRHLFARTYYRIEKDLSRLADILGHSSVDTTKIYTMESGDEHVKQLNRMQLVCMRL